MEVPLNPINESPNNKITFRECAKEVTEINGHYHRKLVILMLMYWIFASFFISFQNYLYKKPIYHGCDESDSSCIAQVCRKCADNILPCVKHEQTLTYYFQFFCGSDWLRVAYKIFPQSLAFFGFLIYGYISDKNGRKVAIKISWRLFTVGIIMYSATQTFFLRSIGYIIASINCYPSLVCQFVLLFQQTNENNRVKASLVILASLFVGPLVLSFVSEPILSALSIRGSLGIMCSIPAFVLSIMVGTLKESPLHIYRESKVRSFNVLNQIAKQNKIQPIMIDLSKSSWKKFKENKDGFIDCILHPKYRKKSFLGFFFIFSTFYIVKTSQISLDNVLTTYGRNLVMNITTSFADITLCLIIARISRTCRYLYVVILIICIVKLLFITIFGTTFAQLQILVFISSIVVRYCSEICYGILLIWSIQTFPTDCRNRLSCFVLSGSSIGCIFAYSFKAQILVLWIFALIFTLSLLICEGFIEIFKHGQMVDTMNGQLYDENDQYHKFS